MSRIFIYGEYKNKMMKMSGNKFYRGWNKVKIAVVDGMGGGLGARIIEIIRNEIEESDELIALGTNSGATSRMLNQGADRGATGENAIRVTVGDVDLIIGPIGIIIPNSMLGEITAVMAEAISDSKAHKILLGIKHERVEIIGLKENSLNELFDEMADRFKT
ncbi:MAG TPA: DUF3842 family protein, partial [Halanaerobiales bacterium]|nr:DUF3842 family protein [Halanaerobiales bacterium]